MIGSKLAHFEIVERIGAGGMAMVYKAYDPTVDRNVAIKVLPEQYANSDEFRVRFEREVQAIGKLEHIHILPIHAYGEQDNHVYMVMRLMQDGTLKDLIKAPDPMPYDDIVRILAQVASALDYAHQHGILHRDIKPANILLDQSNNGYLADFGIAHIMGEVVANLTGNAIIGTPAYMSPEQCMGEDLSPASDQYSLGVVLFEMITSQTPFQHKRPIGIMHMHMLDPVPSAREYRSDLPELAQQVIDRVMAKEPADRYPNCMSMAAAFEQALAGKGLRRLASQRVPRQLRSRIDSALASVQLNRNPADDAPSNDEGDSASNTMIPGDDPSERLSSLGDE
ncbi:MAG: serine/threonine protein kinase [Chloroflexi bacterium]|nr:serine/threonine protein kinase [Chloroflexota bacterium]